MNSTLDLARAPVRQSPVVPALLMLAAFVAPFLLYFDTARSTVAIWQRSETFAHGFIILPMCLWLVWRKRENFYAFPPTPWWPALGAMAGAGLLWMVAGMADVQVAQQYALALMIPATALALFGRQLALSLAFPLLFILAAVPFGEVFIDPLISFTADFTVKSLQLLGIPVLRNGTMFEIPSGNWSVVAACSGVRYLISSVTIGCLYAYLTYRSATRRAIFIALATVAPIIANGLRAVMIVMIGHLSGMTLAVGVDHIIYGWLFFGLVMFLMFWVGNFWRQDDVAIRVPESAATAEVRMPPLKTLAAITAALLLTAAIWPALTYYQKRSSYNSHPVQLANVSAAWPSAPSFTAFTPGYVAPDAASNRTFASSAGAVNLQILYYRNQTRSKSLISSTNRLDAGHEDVRETASGMRMAMVNGRALPIREAQVSTAGGKLLVWQWHWIDGEPTISSVAGKLRLAGARLAGRSDDGAAVFIATPYDERPEQARALLEAFVQAHAAAIDAALEATKGR